MYFPFSKGFFFCSVFSSFISRQYDSVVRLSSIFLLQTFIHTRTDMARLDVTETFQGIMFPGHMHTQDSLNYATDFNFQDTDTVIATYPKSGNNAFSLFIFIIYLIFVLAVGDMISFISRYQDIDMHFMIFCVILSHFCY